MEQMAQPAGNHDSGKAVTDEEVLLVAKLSEAEREVLRAYLRQSHIKEVAGVIGKSTHAAEQRLTRARRKLGVKRSVDAAHMLARVEGVHVYGSPIYATLASIDDLPAHATPSPADDGREYNLLPFPTKGRPWNDMPIWARLATIGVGVLLASASIVLVADLLETVTRLIRQLQ